MDKKDKKEARQQYTVMLKPSTVKEIDKIIEKYGSARSKFMATMIENGLEEMKTMEKAGLFKAVIISEKVMQKFKELLFSGKVSLDKNDNLKITD